MTEAGLDKLAGLEDRVLDNVAPALHTSAQTFEARRRLVWATDWLLLARQGTDPEAGASIAIAARHIREAANQLNESETE